MKFTVISSILLANCPLFVRGSAAPDPIINSPINSFALFKNSGFSACSYVAPHGNSSAPLDARWSQARTAQGFCKAVGHEGTSTILPTNTKASAYLPSWAMTLVELFSITISYLLLSRSGTTQAVKPGAEEEGEVVYTYDGLSILPVLVFDFARLLTWWILCIKNARRHDLSSLSWISVVLWAVPAFYFLSFRALGKPASWVGGAALLTLVQFAASIGLIATRWTKTSIGNFQYIPLDLPSLALPARCSAADFPAELFTDPHQSTARGLQTAQVVFLALGFAVSTTLGSKGAVGGFFVAFACMMLFSCIFLGVSASVWGAAFRWTSGRCFVTVVFVASRLGYLDVVDGRSGRVVQALLGI